MRVFLIRFSLILCIFGLLTFGGDKVALARTPTETITSEAFWQRIEQTLTTLRKLKSEPENTVAPALDELANQWAQVDALSLPDPENPSKAEITVPVDASFLVSELRQRPYNLNRLLNRFGDLQNARSLSPSRTFGKADLAALKVILENPDFQWDREPSPLEKFWEEFWARINDWLNELFGGNGEVNVPVPNEAFTIGASVILVIVLLFVFRALFSDFLIDAAAKDEQMAGDELLTAESALQKAKDISRGGDYRTAVRYLYISSLLTLDERGLMRFDRSKTNREYLRSVAALPQLSAPLRDVIDVFDRVWYGFQPLDEASFQHYAEKVDQLREQKK